MSGLYCLVLTDLQRIVSRSGVLKESRDKGSGGVPRGDCFIATTDEPVNLLTGAWEILVWPEGS